VDEQRAWGDGDYRYFPYPMPQLVSGLRTTLCPYLAPIANLWNERMDISERYPTTHLEYLEICRRAAFISGHRHTLGIIFHDAK
jgi:hypothetical protein